MEENLELYKVGDVVKKCNTSARTLHYYEELKLVIPVDRTPAGHRLYSQKEIDELLQIGFLQQLGLSLTRIQEVLVEKSNSRLQSVLRNQLTAIDNRLLAGQRLRTTLTKILELPEQSELDLVSLSKDFKQFDPAIKDRISMLVYSDIVASFEYLKNVYDLGPGVVEYHNRKPVFASLEIGYGQVWLHPESEQYALRSPATLKGVSSTTAVIVNHVDEHHEYCISQGATIIDQPRDMHYGYREYRTKDLEGHIWCFMQPLAEDSEDHG